MTRVFFAAAGALVLSTGVAWADCTVDNWQGCAGKPWVDGDKMDTPLGSEWWPNKQWGADDEAGSTNYYTKPEIVLRALAEADKGKVYNLGHEYNSQDAAVRHASVRDGDPRHADRRPVRRQQDRLA